jgi:hypothetical protein
MTIPVEGEIVRFKDPYPDEKNDIMVITEWNIDRGFGKHLGTGLNFPPVTLLRLEDIEVVGSVDG